MRRFYLLLAIAILSVLSAVLAGNATTTATAPQTAVFLPFLSNAPLAPTATPTIPSGVAVWVRQEPPVVNVNNDPLYYEYGEPRFEGSFTAYTVNETAISMRTRYVDHGTEWYSVTINSKFDRPPLVLNPGLRYKVNGTFSNSGTLNLGSVGAMFWYSAEKNYRWIVSPQEVLGYYPWEPTFDGTNTKDWMVTAPPITKLGDTFQMYAGWWNCAPCNVTWTYRAEYH
jgi:hypothetical protein